MAEVLGKSDKNNEETQNTFDIRFSFGRFAYFTGVAVLWWRRRERREQSGKRAEQILREKRITAMGFAQNTRNAHAQTESERCVLVCQV